MHARLILGVSVLAFAGAVSAQTVPAEQWVGAPIPAAGSFSRSAVAADYAASRSVASAPQELRVGPSDPTAGMMSRTEVTADLNLWIRSGLSQIAGQDSFDPSNPAYRGQYAMYRQQRNGPEFVAEVQRLKGASARRLTTAQYPSAPAAAH